jgi:hypothetical protein
VLPAINALVRVAVGRTEDPEDGLRASDVPSRVEDVEAPGAGLPARLLVATPRFAGDAEAPAPGVACTLTWTGGDGVVLLPAAFDHAVSWTATWPDEEAGLLRLWWLTVTGAAEHVQRREYFRCPLQVPVRLALLGDVPSGRTTDLGEGGLRCLLQSDPLASGAPVEATLDLPDGSALRAGGVVLRSDRAARAPDHADTVVRFDDPEATGDAVRAVIFAEQLRLRRLGLDRLRA